MRRRRIISDTVRSEIWDRWKRGETLHDIGRVLDRSHTTIFAVLAPTGGIRPSDRKRCRRALTLAEREEISRGLVAGRSMRVIATALGRAASTVSREIARNGGKRSYRANKADTRAWETALRPKPCKLSGSAFLRRVVSDKLRLDWSPYQIAGWLKQTHPEAEHRRVSHETIYKCLFIQARGVLKKELQAHLRAKRAIRRSRQATLKRTGLGQIKDAVSISERPASVEDRAVPGH